MRGLGRRRVSDGPRGGGPRSGTAAAPVGSTRPSDPMRIGRRSFIRRAVPRVMVALSFIRANVLKRRRSLAGRRLVSSSRRPRVVSDKSPRAGIGDVDFFDFFFWKCRLSVRFLRTLGTTCQV